jgi:hypothetical protein
MISKTTRLSTAALMALTGAVALSGFAPAAQAQDRGPWRDGPGARPGLEARPSGAPLAGLLGIACSDRAAERIDTAFLRLSYRVALTEAQKPLFDELRGAALAAQTAFAEDCAAIRPAEADRAAADPFDRMRTRIDLASAHIAALEGLLPKAEAFYDTLDEGQKAKLAEPRRRMGEMRRDNRQQRLERWMDRRDGERQDRRLRPMPPAGIEAPRG